MLNKTYCNRAGITWDTELAILENTFDCTDASQYRVRTALEISQAISNTFRFTLTETEVAVLRNRAIKKMLANGFSLRMFFDIATTVAITGLQHLMPTNASGRAFQKSDLVPFVIDPLNQQSTLEEQSSSIVIVQTQPQAADDVQELLSTQHRVRENSRDEFGLTPRQGEVVQSLYSPETGIRSHKEIGRLLSISSGTVNLTLTKARALLSDRGLTVKQYLQRVGILTDAVTMEVNTQPAKEIQSPTSCETAQAGSMTKRINTRPTDRDEFGLTPRQREVVRSIYLPEQGKRSNKEIARLISISTSTVNTTLHDARKELSKHELTIPQYLQKLGLPFEDAPIPAEQPRPSQRKIETTSRQDEFGLNQRQRDALHLLFTAEGYKRSTNEIAKLLNISNNYVKCTLYTARKELRKHELTIPQYLQKLGLPFEDAPSPARQPKEIKDEFGLSSRQRTVLQLLFTAEGYKRYPNEIATILHISPSNVYTVLSTARAKLSQSELTVKDYLQKLGLPCEAQISEEKPQARKAKPVTSPWQTETIFPPKQEAISKPKQPEMTVKPKPPAKISKPKQAKPISKPVAVNHSKHKELTDVELIIAFQKGNADTFQTLLRRNKKVILAKMYKAGVDPEAVDDFEQKVHIRIWKGLKSLRDPAKFNPWLSTTIKNCWNDELRTMGRSRKHMSVCSLDEPLSIGAEDGSNRLDLIANTKSQANSEYDFQEVERLIEHAISRMPKVFGEALRLRTFGYHYDEIEQLTNTEVGTVKSRVARGRRFLHDILLSDPDRYQLVIDAMNTHGFVK